MSPKEYELDLEQTAYLHQSVEDIKKDLFSEANIRMQVDFAENSYRIQLLVEAQQLQLQAYAEDDSYYTALKTATEKVKHSLNALKAGMQQFMSEAIGLSEKEDWRLH